MANHAHVERLKAGVEAWNAWRASNPGERPDLREADLQGSNLKRFDLTFADLDGATSTDRSCAQPTWRMPRFAERTCAMRRCRAPG